MECSSCSGKIADDARFCAHCGMPAPAAAPATPSDPLREILKLALGRQYEVVRLLGKGGMGAVYLATEAALEREVAIKVLPPDRGATQDSRDRFRREARTAAKLSHPNIVPLYTFGDVDGTLYFVMGYVKGESLAARLKREGRLPVEEARRILIEIAEALDYAHKLGVIHRDIKPDNVLLEQGTGRALLTDFGVAKALGAGQTLTELGSVLGTPQYMSPEQAQGKADIDHRSDLYSLGVMGYAMLAGRLPFEGATPGDIMVQHITKEAPALSLLAPGLPPEIGAALTRCLDKDPSKRWPNAAAFKATLGGSADDEVPIQLEGVANIFLEVLVCALGLWYVAAWWMGGGGLENPIVALAILFLGVTGIGMACLLVSRIRRLRRSGFAESRIQYAAFGQPRWWLGWYPHRLRAPGDVWDQLPNGLRRARALLAGTVVVLFLAVAPNMLTVLAFDWYHSTHLSPKLVTGQMVQMGTEPYPRWIRDAVTNSVLSLFLSLSAAAWFQAWRWERLTRRQLADSELRGYMLVTWTGRRSFWRQPEIAALLLPGGSPSGSASTAEPTTASGFAEAVRAIASALPQPAREAGAPANSAARYLADAIALLDKQIAGLARALDPAETRRLTDRIAALGPDAGADDDNREVRELLGKQLDTLRSLEARIEDAKARRAKRFEIMKALWLHAVALQSASGDVVKTESATGRMKKLLAQINEQDAAPKTFSAQDADTHPLSDAPTLDR